MNLLYESNQSERSIVAIYGLTGKQVYQKQLQNNGYSNHTLNLNSLEKGVYILKFNSGKYQTSKKIIVQ